MTLVMELASKWECRICRVHGGGALLFLVIDTELEPFGGLGKCVMFSFSAILNSRKIPVILHLVMRS